MKKIIIVLSLAMILLGGCVVSITNEGTRTDNSSPDSSVTSDAKDSTAEKTTADSSSGKNSTTSNPTAETPEPENLSAWKLIRGTPPFADPDTIVYEGNVMLTGWGVNVPYYISNPELHFHVSQESIKNLPQEIDFDKSDLNFRIENMDAKTIEALEKSDENNKIELRFGKLVIVQEGRPRLYLAEK